MAGGKRSRHSPREMIDELTRLQGSASVDRLSVIHEISVYQEELRAQNEALSAAQIELEETRDRFIELYDFAPNGYLTLDVNGVIRQVNLTAAAMIGRAKTSLEGLPLLGFVAPADRTIYLAFLRDCRRAEGDIERQFTIRTGDGERHVQALCRGRSTRDGARELLVSLIDVTEQETLAREREQLAGERAALAARLITAQDEERLRISRNLHDDVGQQVTALRLTLAELAASADGSTVVGLARVQEMLQQLDRRLHYVASELRPTSLDLGIVSAMEHFVRQWSSTFGVPAAFHASDVGVLPPHVETHLYRIAQEALNNTAKYAAASQVSVLLERRGEDVVLVVEDNGVGFDLVARRDHGECLGLLGMRERAQVVAGTLEVETAPGRGTSIFVRMPATR